MQTFLVVLLASLVGAVVALLVFRLRGSTPASSDAGLSAEVSGIARRLEGIDSRMTDTQLASQSLASEIFHTLGSLEKATESVAAQAKELSTFQDLFKAPKARGGLGEAMLGELLGQVLPAAAFSLQHRFSTGAIVDAAVSAGGRKICIDAKFPLANYQRMCDASDDVERTAAERDLAADIDGHIRDIAARYILPDEGTLDFAVMYVPSEAVYSEVLRLKHRKNPLFETAMGERVIPMSPLTIYPYLQTIMLGLRCLQIEENAGEILDRCSRLGADIERFALDHEILGRHITNAYSRFGENHRKLDRLRATFDRVIDVADQDGDVDDEPRPPLEVITGD